MKTLIAYATKHGCTEKCANKLKDELGGQVDLINLEKVNKIDLSLYDQVVIGGSVYAGRIRKPVSEFCMQNLDELTKKRIGLFYCGIANGEDIEKEMNTSYPPELLKAASAKEFFGGELILDQMNFLERYVIKKVAKVSSNLSQIRVDKINEFAKVLNM
ncbi:MAG: flavodoxin domain-containing protein [Clostridiaceae bacterium]